MLSKKKIVAAIPLEGVIKTGGLCLESVRDQIDKAYAAEPIMVALMVSSPGGSPYQSQQIHDYIRGKRNNTDIPTVTFVEDVAASGGYFIALAGDKIIASAFSLVGSIGVVGGGFGFVGALEKLGIERRIYTSGVNKVKLDPFSPEKESDKAWISGIQNNIHEIFINHVVKRRGDQGCHLDPRNFDSLFNGDLWLGGTAANNGIVDQVGGLSEYVSSKYGDDIKIQYFRKKKPFFSRLFSKASTQIFLTMEDRIMRSQLGI